MRLALREALDRYNKAHAGAPLDQGTLAERINTSRALVNKHMQGRVAPGARTMERYAKALGCSVGDLYVYDQEAAR